MALTATQLLYGDRRKIGAGPRSVDNITDLFFRIALERAFAHRRTFAQAHITHQYGKTDEELLDELGEKKFAELIKEAVHNKDIDDLICPVLPRKRKIDGNWAIVLGTYFDLSSFEATIYRVGLRGRKFYGLVTINEIADGNRLSSAHAGRAYPLSKLSSIDFSEEREGLAHLIDVIEDVMTWIIDEELPASS